MNKNFIAFTLIELLVVIAIIGILSGLIIVGMSGMTNSATIAKSQVFSNSLRNSLMMNLVSEWKFDDGSGQVAQDTWGTNSATIGSSSGVDSQDPAWVTSGCVSNNCLLFNGSAGGAYDYLTISDSDSLTFSNGTVDTPFTFEFWFKSGDESTVISILDKTNEYSLTANYSLRIYLRDSVGGGYLQASAGGIARDNKWKHAVVTYSGNGSDTGFSFYINTVRYSYPEGIFGTYVRTRNTANPVYFGYTGLSSSTVYFDNLRIYNATIPTSQIKENYYAGLNSLFAKGLINENEYHQRIADLENKTARN